MLKITRIVYDDYEDRMDHGLPIAFYKFVKDDEVWELSESSFSDVYHYLTFCHSINAKFYLNMLKKALRGNGCKRGLLEIQQKYYDNFFDIFRDLGKLSFFLFHGVSSSKYSGSITKQYDTVLKEYSKGKSNKKTK